MAETTSRTSASSDKVREFLTGLPSVLSGHAPDTMGVRKAVLAKVIAAALEDVRKDFDAKSGGGTGVNGQTWEPLSVYTIKQRAEAKKGTSGRSGGSPEERKPPDYGWIRAQRREVFRKEYARLRLAGVPPKEAARQAAIIAKFVSTKAWKVASQSANLGQPGRPGQFQPGDFPILNDTGTLAASASPGKVSGSGMAAAYVPAENQQVVYGRGFFSVESMVQYGDKHMYDGEGDTTGGFRPARPWKFGEDVPQAWLDRWAKVFSDSLAEVLADVIQRL